MGEDKELKAGSAAEEEEEPLIDDDFSIMPDDDWASAIASKEKSLRKDGDKSKDYTDVIPADNEDKEAVADPTELDIPSEPDDVSAEGDDFHVVPDKNWDNTVGSEARVKADSGQSEESTPKEGHNVFDELDDIIPADNEDKEVMADPTELDIPSEPDDVDAEGDDFHVVPDKKWNKSVGNEQRLGADVEGATAYAETVSSSADDNIDGKELDNIIDSISSDSEGKMVSTDEAMSESADSILEDEFLSSVPVADNAESTSDDSNDMLDDIPAMPDLASIRRKDDSGKKVDSELDKLAADEDGLPEPETEDTLLSSADEGLLELSPADEVRNENAPIPSNPLVDIVEAKAEDIKAADLNLSGLLSYGEIEEAGNEIQIKREDIEELFSMEDELQEPEDDDSGDIVDLERDIRGIEELDRVNLSRFLTEENIEKIINDAVRNSILDLNETIFREKLGEALEKIIPQIVAVAEKTVWDIVPDMARTLIKKEIDRIREEE